MSLFLFLVRRRPVGLGHGYRSCPSRPMCSTMTSRQNNCRYTDVVASCNHGIALRPPRATWDRKSHSLGDCTSSLYQPLWWYAFLFFCFCQLIWTLFAHLTNPTMGPLSQRTINKSWRSNRGETRWNTEQTVIMETRISSTTKHPGKG